jgi:LmbE family N-acetylglucosaminyl deacetylase
MCLHPVESGHARYVPNLQEEIGLSHAKLDWYIQSGNSVTELIVLAAFAHPDDETIFAGGILAMLADRGANLHILLATRGEGGELGEPPLTDRAGLGEVREHELRCAAEVLGASSVMFLDYIDPLVGEDESLYPFEAEFETLAQELVAAMEATGAHVLITHGSNGEYGHPAHALMHRACLLALQSISGDERQLYTIAADFPDHPKPRVANKGDPAHFVLNIEPWLPVKHKAASCHRTQGALFVRRASKEAGRPVPLKNVLMRIESLRRAWPTQDATLVDPLTHFLRQHCGEAILMDTFYQAPMGKGKR